MDEDSTFGMTPEGLARLLLLGKKCISLQDKLIGNREPAELVLSMLDNGLPTDLAKSDSRTSVRSQAHDDVPRFPGKPVRDLLLDSKTELAIIKALKEYAKELVHRHSSDAEHAAATAIYYAAIASALLFHGAKITRYSYEKLDEGYAKLEKKPWIPSELKELFRRAKAACQGREENAG